MPTYKTPDVYVEEISIFPPSVAEVETAIPAFIGYTEKASEIVANDLMKKAHKIDSITEFEQFYGGAPPMENVVVTMDLNKNPEKVELSQEYYLYDSLRMFFDNGGGKCYIISVGHYGDPIQKSDLMDGIAELKKIDEPTIISSPDAALLSNTGLYDFQKAALDQSGKLGDRVVLCDLKNVDGSVNHDDVVQEFRDNIGIKNLKYGAAYTPWLKTSLPKKVRFRDITLQDDSGSVIQMKNLTDDEDIKKLIDNLINHNKISQTDDSFISGLSSSDQNINMHKVLVQDNLGSGNDTLQQEFNSLVETYLTNAEGFSGIEDHKSDLRSIYEFLSDLADSLITFHSSVDGRSGDIFDDFKKDINSVIDDNLEDNYQNLIYHSKAIPFSGADIFTASMTSNILSSWTDLSDTSDSEVDQKYTDAADHSEQGILALTAARKAFLAFATALNSLGESLDGYETTYHSALVEAYATYKSVLNKINDELSELPPSGAIAGVYAFVDRNRGVHKAPANVSLNSVTGFSTIIDSEEQKGLNVDVNAGKSINALRTFTGKGHLVWGARTLAGNDNEWRYISVRRFFNMVEESVKKSTYWAVFEPNNANTWVKVRTMIENYLTQKWRDGALAGAKPDQAFFVKVGLGLTMTQQDILEGRMNVEIGMAVVRPAEFIILKFSHKMQEA
ncbi:MAG: phage tail sheath C-terminal domain-containing protein [Balneolaceae bacterium]|nr:phage tail sheath C-terminal domain-containing protein [Balneolaceae bacterium]